MKALWLISLVLFLKPYSAVTANAGMNGIRIMAADNLLEDPVTGQSLADFRDLLHQACSCEVGFNSDMRGPAAVIIELPGSVPPFTTEAHRVDSTRPYPYFHYPDHGYTWNMKRSGEAPVLELTASSAAGVSNGLYGLLQEKLGFSFLHPRETLIPAWKGPQDWPLAADSAWTWTARPRFSKMGFHIHTQHPLELTEQLMMLDDDSWEDVKEYIDWLARNQQNYFEFNLLEGIDRNTWPALAKRMTDYLHSRGIIAGLDLSLHMIQQKSFMLYQSPPNSHRKKETQILNNTQLLFEADWDVWNVEFSTTEFTGGNVEQKKKLQAFLNAELMRRNCKLMGRIHVVKEEEMLDGRDTGAQLDAADDEVIEERELDAHRGIMSHTVMFYTASEQHAPVYGNENLQHMLELLISSSRERETWYYPESAYWITFDNSVPLFLLPYLTARLDDILLMDSLRVEGHLTFSSGWEWGYWLIDWSIARWSWEHTLNGAVQVPAPGQYINSISADSDFRAFFDAALEMQEDFLKRKNMIRFMVAQTVTDEMPGPFNLQLHPRPEWPYKWIMNNSGPEEWEFLETKVLSALKGFHDSYFELREGFDFKTATGRQAEILGALDVVALRAIHRFYTLKAMIQSRQAELDAEGGVNFQSSLDMAAGIRLKALDIVKGREASYRYDLTAVAGKRWDHTCYHFGYLFPVHDLHFWKREEMQIRKDKWGPLFMNIWNIRRTIGLID